MEVEEAAALEANYAQREAATDSAKHSELVMALEDIDLVKHVTVGPADFAVEL